MESFACPSGERCISICSSWSKSRDVIVVVVVAAVVVVVVVTGLRSGFMGHFALIFEAVVDDVQCGRLVLLLLVLLLSIKLSSEVSIIVDDSRCCDSAAAGSCCGVAWPVGGFIESHVLRLLLFAE